MGNRTSSGGPSKAFRLPPAGARVIHPDGRMQEFGREITAGDVMAANPKNFVCSSEYMQVNANMVMVHYKEQLELGQLYFLIPHADAHRPLNLPELCTLAVKASAAITRAT